MKGKNFSVYGRKAKMNPQIAQQLDIFSCFSEHISPTPGIEGMLSRRDILTTF